MAATLAIRLHGRPEPGHDHTPFRHPSYRALVHNSIIWTGGKLK